MSSVVDSIRGLLRRKGPSSAEQAPPVPAGGLPPEQDLGDQYLIASQWQLIKWKFFRHKMAVVSLVVLGILYFGALFAEFVSPYDPYEFDADLALAPPQTVHFVDEDDRFHLRPFFYPVIKSLDPDTWVISYTEDRSFRMPLRMFVRGSEYELWGLIPSNVHLFGVRSDPCDGDPEREGDCKISVFGRDPLGRDLLSRIIYGSRISLTIGLLGIAFSFIFGILVGGISGYFGGRIDIVIQRIIEAIRAIPTLPLWMALSVSLPPHWPIVRMYFAIVMILAIVGWTDIARVVRGKFLAVREEEYIMAAELDGASTPRLIFRYLLPSFYSYIIARLTLSIPAMILGETSLSFIGLGLQAPAISWGVLLKDAQHIRVLADAPWILIPGLFVVISILAFNFEGDGLRDAADPYTRT